MMSPAKEAKKVKKWVMKNFPKETISDRIGMFLVFPIWAGSVQYSRDKQIGFSGNLFVWKLSHMIIEGIRVNLSEG